MGACHPAIEGGRFHQELGILRQLRAATNEVEDKKLPAHQHPSRRLGQQFHPALFALGGAAALAKADAKGAQHHALDGCDGHAPGTDRAEGQRQVV